MDQVNKNKGKDMKIIIIKLHLIDVKRILYLRSRLYNLYFYVCNIKTNINCLTLPREMIDTFFKVEF